MASPASKRQRCDVVLRLRASSIAEFLPLRDFYALVACSRERLEAVEDVAALAALASAYPVLRSRAVRARVAASGRELIQIANATRPLKEYARLDDISGFELHVEITLKDVKILKK